MTVMHFCHANLKQTLAKYISHPNTSSHICATVQYFIIKNKNYICEKIFYEYYSLSEMHCPR